MDLNDRFDALDEALKLNKKERDRAIKAHGALGGALTGDGVAKKTRLQGSFARKTMLPPLKDVDKIIELADDVADDVDDTPGGPLDAARRIEEVVRKAFPGATFDYKRHALGITLPGETFEFDAVPAINDDDTASDIIRIANLEDDSWDDSNTYVLIDTISTRNGATKGTFIHVVRMVKHLFLHAGIDKIPGIHIETFTYDAVTTDGDYPDLIADTLASASTMLTGDYDDPTGVDRISDRIPLPVRSDAKAIVDRCLTTANEAVAAAGAGDERKAANLWADLLGDEFPRPADSASRRSTLAAMQHRTPTRSWRLS